MTNAWTENGPVSLPPRSLAYGAGALLVILAIAGVALGLRAAWREAGAPDLGAPAAIANAVNDAIRGLGISINTLPIKVSVLGDLIAGAQEKKRNK